MEALQYGCENNNKDISWEGGWGLKTNPDKVVQRHEY